MSGSLLVFFHLCLVSVLSSGPSLTEMKFYRNFSGISLVHMSLVYTEWASVLTDTVFYVTVLVSGVASNSLV